MNLFKKNKRFGKIRYSIDVLTPERISGWAWKVGFPKHVCQLEFCIDGKCIAKTSAGTMREDLLAAGIGSGCHGFDVDPGLSMFAEYPKDIEVLVDGKLVSSTPIVLRPDYEKVLERYGQAMEKRMDALLALHKERVDREMEEFKRSMG